MDTKTRSFSELLTLRNSMLLDQKELYISAVQNINLRNRELLKNDFGATLLKNCAWDAADILVDKYFDTKDYYISPQQLFERIVHFSYDDSHDPLSNNASIRKALYENQNSADILQDIFSQSKNAGEYLFSKERKKDPIDSKTREYRKRRTADGTLVDDITGKEGSSHIQIKNNKEVSVSNLHADHIQARDSIKYDPRYINKDRIKDMQTFYYSDQNFWLIHASANTSKGAVRVYKSDNGVIFLSDKEYKAGLNAGKYTEKNDITWKASAEQLADATIQIWEKETPSKNKFTALQNEGYLDENNKVLPEVREKLIETYKDAMNAESLRMVLPYFEEAEDGQRTLKMPWLNYKNIAKDAEAYARASVKKIIVGQIIYYVLPPMVFETQTIVKKKDMTVDRFFKEIKQSGKRIIRYVSSKLGEIFKNVAGNTFNKFLKTFFDIIIEATKETVKRILSAVKQLVMSLVSCVRTISNKNSSPAEKADAVTKTLAVTITSVLLEVLFEWAEKQFSLPDLLMEPLQVVVTVLVTNLVMLILQKADLFDVQYGLLVANIEQVFEEERLAYLQQSEELMKIQEDKENGFIDELSLELNTLEQSISSLDLYEEDVTDSLNKINKIFNMGIDFDKEWEAFIGVPCGGI